MAPVRRYLRITKYSVLEVRIFLEDPAFTESWLLRPGNPALPRVLEAVRPLVLPKLREENERARGKGKSKKGVKDVVSRDEFDVSIFLTETSTRHSLLIKSKDFTQKKHRIRSNSGKMTRWLDPNIDKEQTQALDESDRLDVHAPITIREEEDDDDSRAAIKLSDIPKIPCKESKNQESQPSRKRTTATVGLNKEDAQEINSDDGNSSNENDGDEAKKTRGLTINAEDAVDDKKKLLLHTTYDGFSIYGRILCLIVNYKKPATARQGVVKGGPTPAQRTGQQMLEQWASSQAILNNPMDEVEDG